jgi:hypothetical protein
VQVPPTTTPNVHAPFTSSVPPTSTPQVPPTTTPNVPSNFPLSHMTTTQYTVSVFGCHATFGNTQIKC